jgi:hypothetical protein
MRTFIDFAFRAQQATFRIADEYWSVPLQAK